MLVVCLAVLASFLRVVGASHGLKEARDKLVTRYWRDSNLRSLEWEPDALAMSHGGSHSYGAYFTATSKPRILKCLKHGF